MNKLLVDLEKLDVDVNKTLSRFMDNEELYLTFLYRFPNENKFNELKEKIENEEYDDCILVIAHTLKGQTANLGMNGIYRLVCEIMKSIKKSQFNEIKEKFLALEENYNQICDVIMKYKRLVV
ncbi:MAG: hypothetical protein GX286_01110 [Clostridiales bacterium]|nr:hypothetical protein [Clostridiales bacterium]